MARVVVLRVSDGGISVFGRIGPEFSQIGDQRALSKIFGESDAEDLRFYLKDFVKRPVGLYKERADLIATPTH